MSSLKRKVLTLVLLRTEAKVLLGMKKRGFGAGKWNGFGGKVEAGETVVEAAAREVQEECGLTVKTEDLGKTERSISLQKFLSAHFHIAEEVGLIEQEFEGDPVVLEIHVFQTRTFSGAVSESEEMRPEWFSETDIPFKQMWLDDELWYPHLLKNNKFKGYFLFKGHEKILDYTLTEI